MTDKHTVLKDLIETRRTVKPDCFNGEKIEDHLIEEILASANWAPTHAYTEPWRFVVFKDKGLMELGNFLAKLDQPNLNATEFNATRFERLQQRPVSCSHVIGIGLKRGDNPKVPEVEEISSVAMAVQNLWLSAHALNLSGYWSTGSLAFRDETRDFLGLQEGDKSLGFFYLGKSNKPLPQGRRLSDIDDKVNWRS